MFPLPKTYLIRIIIELILTVIIIILPYKLYKYWGRPTKRGFFCDDESLKYPYHEDTVTTKILYLCGVGIPVVVITIGELIKQLVFKQKNTKIVHCLWQLLLMCHEHITPFLFFMSSEHFVSSVIKFSMGRLRPHFFAVCQPQRLDDNTTCGDEKNHGIYIKDYDCHPHNSIITKFMLINAHLSFPSGHSSLIFYGMIFTVIYLQRFSKCLHHHQYKLNFGLLVPLLQMLCVLLASFVAVSRVVDYKHHWSDVLAGILLGSSVAIAVSFYVQQQIARVAMFLKGNTGTSMPDTEMTFNTPLPNPMILP